MAVSSHIEEKTFQLFEGAVIRLLTLMTHYRQPLNFSKTRMAEAERILQRWMSVATPSLGGPPLEILEAFCDDLNTPKAIAAMHVYRKNGDGEKLFRAMKFLGFFNSGTSSMPTEWKTLPEDHLSNSLPCFDVNTNAPH